MILVVRLFCSLTCVSWLAFVYLGQHLRKVAEWLEDILLWLEDRLEDIPFSSLSSSLYCVKSQRVVPILEDMADFFAYRVIMHETASLLFGVLSVFLTIFLAYDNAQLRKEIVKNVTLQYNNTNIEFVIFVYLCTIKMEK